MGQCIDKGDEDEQKHERTVNRGVFTLMNAEIEKVKCVDGEVKMFNIRNRNKSSTSGISNKIDTSGEWKVELSCTLTHHQF